MMVQWANCLFWKWLRPIDGLDIYGTRHWLVPYDCTRPNTVFLLPSSVYLHLLPLMRLQKKIIRLMTLSHYRESSAPLFNRLGLLNFNQLYIFHVIFFMYKFVNNLLPPMFDGVFSRNTPGIHNTRILLPFRPPFFRLATCRRCVSYQGPYYFNSYFHLFDSSTSKTVFKKQLKLTRSPLAQYGL
jgi:hypothetical protein